MFTPREVEAALSAVSDRVQQGISFEAVSIDSRTAKPGDLFIAIQGPKFDGHRFLEDACRRGARGFVVRRGSPEWENIPSLTNVFSVEDTTEALGNLAKAYLGRFKLRSVAVTGSCGKTTTKELCFRTLSKKYSVHATQGNLNNQYGLPLTIFRIAGGHDVFLAELGANHPGDIEYLSGIASPEIGIITSVYPAHLEGFGSMDGVYRAKLELGAACEKKNGILIVNGDNEELVRRARKLGVRLVTFGRNAENEYRAENVCREGDGVALSVRGHRFRLRSRALFNADNLLAAVTLAHVMGVSFDEMPAEFHDFQAAGGRFETRTFGKGVSVVYDAYNANPGSVMRSLESFAGLKTDNRRMIAVLGDMKELGNESRELHRNIGRNLEMFGLDELVAVGSDALEIAEGAKEKGACGCIRYFQNNREASEFLSATLRSGDMVLLKGSRSMKLEEILECLENKFA